MEQGRVESKAERAAERREYARHQGEQARKLKAGEGVLFYRTETQRGREVRVACRPEELSETERQRQINEAVRNAEKARTAANKEAKAIESE
jgi:hypothetical protein